MKNDKVIVGNNHDSKTKFTDFATYEVNPFWDELFARAPFKVWLDNKIKDKEEFDKDGNSLRKYKEADKGYKIYDSQPFIKVFKLGLPDIKRLSSPAGMLLWYLIEGLKENCDEVRFDIDTYVSETGKNSKSAVYKSLFQLCKAELIARKAGSDGYLYINIRKIFYGDRAKHEQAKPHVAEMVKAKKQSNQNG